MSSLKDSAMTINEHSIPSTRQKIPSLYEVCLFKKESQMIIFETSPLKNQQPVLSEGEQLIFNCAQVGIYNDEVKIPDFEQGRLYITNHRLIWVSQTDAFGLGHSLYFYRVKEKSEQLGFLTKSPKITLKITQPAKESDWNCPICSSINVGSQISKCSICGVQRKVVNQCLECTLINPDDYVSCQACGKSLLGDQSEVIIKFSFRSYGQPESSKAIDKALATRVWETSKPSTTDKLGVAGILNNIQATTLKQKQTLNSSKDLQELMAKAHEIIEIVNNYKQKVVVVDDGLKMDLLEFGIDIPVTKVTSKEFKNELTIELERFLDRLCRPIISLTDLYCLFNRARGIALVSPLDLVCACENLSRGYRMMTFTSGSKIVCSPTYSEDIVCAEIESLIAAKGCLSPAEYSKLKNISTLISREYFFLAEMRGILCRDDTVQGIFYYLNIFKNMDP